MEPESLETDLEKWSKFLNSYGIDVNPTSGVFFRDTQSGTGEMLTNMLRLEPSKTSMVQGVADVEIHFRLHDGKFMGIDID